MKSNRLQLPAGAQSVVSFAKRNISIYLRDPATVFFSLFAPLIILVLYVLFLRDVQVDTVMGFFKEAPGVSDSAVRAFVDSWMIAGVVSVCCISVALSSMNVMVDDREKGIFRDFATAPVKAKTITLGYFIAFFAITFLISFIVYAIGLVYLAACGSFFMTVPQVFEGIGNLFLSCLSSAMIMMFIISFFKSASAVGAFTGVLSAVIGFVIGAYMPISIFPTAVQYFTNFVPGSYSAGLFRNILMSGALENLTAGAPAAVVETLKEAYALKLNFFGIELGMGWMYGILAFSAALFFVINLLRNKFRKKDK